MKNMENIQKQKIIFTRLFLLSNKLQVMGDQVLLDEMTIRQWLLSAAIAQFGDNPPTLSDAAEFMGTSHQNVKQLVLKLEQKGFLNIKRDERDHRVTRLILTEKSFEFCRMREKQVRNFLRGLFKDIDKEETRYLEYLLNKLYQGVLKMEKKL